MTARAILAAAIAGCGGGNTTVAPDAGPIDARPIDAPVCFGTYGYCFTTPPAGELVLRDALNTASDPRCDAATSAVCLIGAHDIVVTQALVLSGARPLALVARTIQVDGSITLAKMIGNPADCIAPTAPAQRAGYAGGSFGTRGGNGGASQQGAGGVASAATVPAGLRGGCSGAGDDAGTGLAAGGLALIASQQITLFVRSWINACGGGGLGAQTASAGGGGGGSGGMVLLDAPVIELDGSVLALGGGGGGGSTTVAIGIGGATGCNAMSSITAPGGNGPNGRGGDGATTGTGAAGAAASSGAGGGGGGAGVILVHGTTTGAGQLIPAKTSIGP